MVISLLGTLTIQFLELEGKDQKIQLQLPNYVLANFIHVEGKPRVSLISGYMCLEDKDNQLKSVIQIHGLVKKNQLFQTTYEPNLTGEKLIEGIIYKTKKTDQ